MLTSRLLLRLSLVLTLTVASAATFVVTPALAATPGQQFGSFGQYGESFRGGGFDSTAYDAGKYDKALTPGKFIDPVGFTVDTHDGAGGAGTALYVLDRVSDNPAAVANAGGATTKWRLQKLSDGGAVLGTDEFTLPADASNEYVMVGLAVNAAQKRVYALVVGYSPDAGFNGGEYVKQILAWSATPDAGKHLVAATGTGASADTLTGAVAPYAAPAKIADDTTLSPMITDPQGLAVDVTGGNQDLAVQSDDDTSHADGSGIEQVSTTTGALTKQWSSSVLSSSSRNQLDDAAPPAGISTAPDGSLTVLLANFQSPDETVVNVPADLGGGKILSSDGNEPSNSPDFEPVFPTVEQIQSAGDDGFGGIQVATSMASPDVVGLSNGLYAGEFEPDQSPTASGGKLKPTSDPENPSGGPGVWTHLTPGMRLLNPTADGALSIGTSNAPIFPVSTVFDTLGNSVVNQSGATEAASACNLSDPVSGSVADAAAAGGPVPSLAAGAGGAVWVLTRGGDSSPTASGLLPAANPTGGRELIELVPNAGKPCPGPTGTFSAQDTQGSAAPAPASTSTPLTVAVGDTVKFDGSAIDYRGAAPSEFSWDFGDGRTLKSDPGTNGTSWPSATASEQYTKAGTYTVTLKLFGDYGEYDETGTIVVGNSTPATAAFSFSPASPQTSQTVTFDGSASAATPGGALSDYHWNWGDGTVDDAATPTDTHQFAAAGTYTVTLTVHDTRNAQSAPVSHTVTVTSPPAPPPSSGGSTTPPAPPTAAFTFTPSKPQIGQAVSFSAAGSSAQAGASLAGYHWSWGDGASADTASPTDSHTYTVPGKHTVQLTVRDNRNLSSTVVSQVITVNAPPPHVNAAIVTQATAARGVAVNVSCPTGQTSCAGAVKLQTATAVATSAKKTKKKAKKPLVLGKTSFHLAGGKSKTVYVRLTAKAKALLQKSHTVKVLATITDTNASGKTVTMTKRLTLHYAAPAKKKKKENVARRTPAVTVARMKRLALGFVFLAAFLAVAPGPAAADSLASGGVPLLNPGAPGDVFGTSVAISGDLVVVGAPGATVNGNSGQGAVYVYRLSPSHTSVGPPIKLVAPDGRAGDQFGFSVAISGDVLAVGAPALWGRPGEVYEFAASPAGVFTASGAATLTASDAAVGSGFGYSVAIAAGDTVVGGAPFAGTDEQGAVYEFDKPAHGGVVNATQSAKLVSTDTTARWLGFSVATHDATIVAGAPTTNTFFDREKGAAYVFGTNGVQEAKLTAPDGTNNARFGLTVATSGQTIAVGAPYADDAGEAYAFAKPSTGWADRSRAAELTWAHPSQFGQVGDGLAVLGHVLIAGAPFSDDSRGSTLAFVAPTRGFVSATQTEQVASPQGHAGDYFGFSVALSSTGAVIGSPGAGPAPGTEGKGTAYYVRFRQPIS